MFYKFFGTLGIKVSLKFQNDFKGNFQNFGERFVRRLCIVHETCRISGHFSAGFLQNSENFCQNGQKSNFGLISLEQLLASIVLQKIDQI